MSIMCCVYVPEGIVMAADSRLTRTKPWEAVEPPVNEGQPKLVVLSNTTFTSSDNTQKVLLLKKVGVGISFCGNAIIGGATVADYIRRFEIDKVIETDTTEEVAKKLAEHYGQTETHFFVCGYDEDVPYVFDVFGDTAKRTNIMDTVQVASSAKITADDGDREPEMPSDVGAPENLKDAPSGEEFEQPERNLVRYRANWAGQKTAITKVINNPPVLNADWVTMPLKDAIDFAEFLIDTTIKYERFCDDIQTCGGDIDILVITKDEAFWKQHKIYNPIK